MTTSIEPGSSPAARSFAEHVRSFHASLSEDEQKLLEKVFALAEQAASTGGNDVQGYAVDAFIWFDRGNAKVAPSAPSPLMSLLGGPIGGGRVSSVPMP